MLQVSKSRIGVVRARHETFARIIRLEPLIHLHLQPHGQPVAGVGQRDDLDQLGQHLVVHALLARRGDVGVDAVLAVVGDADREIDVLLGQGIEPALLDHHLLHVAPEALEHRRMHRQRAPDVVDVVGVAGLADVVEHLARLGLRALVVLQLDQCHGFASSVGCAGNLTTARRAAAIGQLAPVQPPHNGGLFLNPRLSIARTRL